MPTDEIKQVGECQECGAPVIGTLRSFDSGQATNIARRLVSAECTSVSTHEALTQEQINAWSY